MNRLTMKTDLVRWTTLLALLVAMPAAGASAAPVQDVNDQQLPEAETLLDRHVEAIGGKEALLKLTTRKKTGTLAIDMAGHAFEATVEEQFQAPDKSHSTIDANFFIQVNVCDGENAWEWRPGHSDGTTRASMDSGETELLKGDALSKSLAKARFHAATEWRERFASVKTVGIVDVEGKPAYEVHVTTKKDKQTSHFYDRASGRLVKRTGSTSGHMGELDMEVFLQDYREFDGVWLATRVHVVLSSPTLGEGTQTWTYTKIEHDQEIPASLFKMPEELRASIETSETSESD